MVTNQKPSNKIICRIAGKKNLLLYPKIFRDKLCYPNARAGIAGLRGRLLEGYLEYKHINRLQLIVEQSLERLQKLPKQLCML
jgi:hypothetical protein